MSDDGDVGKRYWSFIEAELRAEVDRRNLAIGRSTSAMTAATGLVTLFLAVAAVLLGKDFVLTNVWAQSLMIATVVALLLSAVCAVMGAFPRKYDAPSSEMLDEMVETNWGDAEVEAERVTAYANVKAIESLRKSTAIGVRYLIAAGVLQIAAVAALGGCYWQSLTECQTSNGLRMRSTADRG